MTYAGVFNLRSFDRSLPSGRPLYSFSISSVYHNTDDCLILVTRKLPITRWPSLLIHVRSRYREKSLGLTILFNIGTIEAMGGTAGEVQAKPGSLCSVS